MVKAKAGQCVQNYYLCHVEICCLLHLLICAKALCEDGIKKYGATAKCMGADVSIRSINFMCTRNMEATYLHIITDN